MELNDYDAAIPKDTLGGLASGRDMKSWVICQGSTFHCGGNVSSKTDRGEGVGFRPWHFQMKQVDLVATPLGEQVLRPGDQRAWLTQPGMKSPKRYSLSSWMASQ